MRKKISTPEHNNAMTIGWGALGNIWSKIGPGKILKEIRMRYTERQDKMDNFAIESHCFL